MPIGSLPGITTHRPSGQEQEEPEALVYVNERVFEWSSHPTLTAFVESVRARFPNTPDTLLKLDIEPEYNEYGDDFQIRVTKYRPETAKEGEVRRKATAKREAEDAKRAAKGKAAAARRERAEYLKLKKKYEKAK